MLNNVYKDQYKSLSKYLPNMYKTNEIHLTFYTCKDINVSRFKARHSFSQFDRSPNVA